MNASVAVIVKNGQKFRRIKKQNHEKKIFLVSINGMLKEEAEKSDRDRIIKASVFMTVTVICARCVLVIMKQSPVIIKKIMKQGECECEPFSILITNTTKVSKTQNLKIHFQKV